MPEKKELAPLKTCLIPIDAQPPTFGMVMSIMAISDNYDEIVICIRDNPLCLETPVVVKMFSLVFRLPKFMVVSNKANFEEIVDFPQNLPYFNYVATLSERIYTNLAIKGYGTYLIPRAVGYDECFHRHAWRQSNALDILRSHVKQVPIDQYKKPTNVTVEEGDENDVY